MIDVKTAVLTATNYLADLLGRDQVKDVRLEEVEQSDDGLWYVTLSYVNVQPKMSPMARLILPEGEREYKVLAIREDNGQVRSMKIRSRV